jgi:hypothetical protein
MRTLCALCHIPGLVVAAAVAVASLPTPAPAQSLGRSYDIMTPEPWQPPRSRSIATPRNPSTPAGLPDYNRIGRADDGPKADRIPKSKPLKIQQEPQPTIVPGIGAVPNLPQSPSVRGRETFNDRAIRCSHQSGVFNVPPGQTGTYIRNCAN